MKNQTTLYAVFVSAVMSVAAPALALADHVAPAPTPLCGENKADNGKKGQTDAKGEKSVKGDKKDNDQKDTAKPSAGAA